jgi:carbamoyltransferase
VPTWRNGASRSRSSSTSCSARSSTTDATGARCFGGVTFAAFDAANGAHRAAAAALRDRLIACGFGPAPAAALFGVRDLWDVAQPRAADYDALPRDAAGTAARLFVLHRVQTDDAVRALLGDALLQFLAAMFAVVPVDGGWRSVVSITWFADALVFADARAYNVIWPGEPAADYVMPPGVDSAGLFRVAPRTPRRCTLDLCCGSGAQALAAAAYSDRVIGVDVNPRALRFAAVNAAANRIDRISFRLGDTYDSLGDERFDAMLANPPFVPWPDDAPALLYRGGGPRGEDVLARIMAGAVARLEPLGTLVVAADFADVAELPAAIARWQGERRLTLVILQTHHALPAYADLHAAHLDDPRERRELALRLERHFAEVNIRTLDFGYLVQRAERGNAYVMATPAALTDSLADDVSAWLDHQHRRAQGTSDDAPLELAPGLRVDAGFLVPGPGSMLAPMPLSAAAVALVERIATTSLRRRDVAGDALAARELRWLFDGGWIRSAR